MFVGSGWQATQVFLMNVSLLPPGWSFGAYVGRKAKPGSE